MTITHSEWNAEHPADAQYQTMLGNDCHGVMETDDSGVVTCHDCNFRAMNPAALSGSGDQFVAGRHDSRTEAPF